MEFGIRDIYDPEDHPSADQEEGLEQEGTPMVGGMKRRARKKPKKGQMRERRPANVAAESDY